MNPIRKYLHNAKKNRRIFVELTGAGISTESGIPDYRSKDVGLYATSDKRPVLYKDFVQKDYVRRRYWARNYVGWPRFSSFEPNFTHRALRHLEIEGRLQCIVTQNVDRLHTKAGSRNVIELHGTAYTVVCLGCNKKINRFDFQKILKHLNPTMIARTREIRPDGDVELTQEQVDDFVVPSCDNCEGILKPDIVFFGDNVPRTIVENVRENVDQSDALLVLGSSITTFSGYRIILQAVEAKKPIAVVNIGESRADKHAVLKVSSRCGEVLSKLFENCHEMR
ncbi:NAD-dependent protein deacylase Sirt4 isoform X2 [Venturia canescens]|uniref:NAD-dependent protein deacylase Sirt4 isoform X2 n=1 Tax=Venturia canescens TaxID=32260 RepID=UPI001C9BCE73|nr:NAD-dependent protein deacylase Sirt4 isoform X2 [Venturia canescens]